MNILLDAMVDPVETSHSLILFLFILGLLFLAFISAVLLIVIILIVHRNKKKKAMADKEICADRTGGTEE